MKLDKNIFGRYKVNKKDSESYILISIASVAFILCVYFFLTTETRWDSVIPSRWKTFVREIINFSDVTGDQFKEMLVNIFYTIMIAAAVTITTLLLALPISVFGAKNMYKGPVATIVKGFAATVRAVPTIVWAMIFVPIFGLDIRTAILGMTFHSLAFFIKAFSESFEEIEPGITEALAATGANKMKIAYSAIMPASFKKIVGWVLLRLEINIAVVIVVAPAIGVPNSIGYLIFIYFQKGFYGQLGLIFILIVISTLSIEKISNTIMKKI